jgi:aryl-alcohol dehydrogenase-like predicted oxidoreductase
MVASSLGEPASVEQSQRRLGTDYIDLYYAHFPDPHTPLEQTLSVYDDLVRQGKLRYVALSNHPAWQVTHALWIADDRRLAAAPVGVQVKYNLIDRTAERELAAACLQFGLSILPFGPLHGGLLAGTQIQHRGIHGDKRFRRVRVHRNRVRDRPGRRAVEPGLEPAAIAGFAGLAALPPSGRVSDRRRRNRGRDHRQRHSGDVILEQPNSTP